MTMFDDYLFEYLMVILFSLFTRLIFIIGESSDDYSHLWMVKERAAWGNLKQNNVTNSLIKGFRGYPPFEHYVIALFPPRLWRLAGKIINLLYDVLSTIIVLVTSQLVFRYLGVEEYARMSLYAALLFGSAPILFPVTARLQTMGGGRSLGLFFFLCFMLCLSVLMILEIWVFYFAAVSLVVLIVIVSQFCMQNLIFTCIILSILYGSWIPITILLSGFGVGLVLGPLDIYKLLQRKWFHYKWYIRNKERGTTASGRNRIRDLVYLPLHLVRNPGYAMAIVFYRNSILIAAYSLPAMWVFCYIVFSEPAFIPDVLLGDKILTFCFYWLLSSAIVFLFTSLSPFLFLGQSERYFEYSVAPLSLLTVVGLQYHGMSYDAILLLVIVNVSVIALNFIVANKDLFSRAALTGLYGEPSFSELVKFLGTLDELKLITLPTKINFKIAASLEERGKYYFDNICDTSNDGLRYMEEDHVILHYFKPDFEYFNRKYGINIFVFQRDALKKASSFGINYALGLLNVIFENDGYIVGKYKG
ncbi:MAG: hypothetical protein ACFE7E_05525 [Candidatus Hodarchaeota archaeon]